VKRERWNEKWRERGTGAAVEPNRFLVAEASGMSPGRALDLASGAGRNAIWLARRGWNVTAVDYSEVGLDEARRRATEQAVEVEWVTADLIDWSPPAGRFDLVCVLYLQLPREERRLVLGRAAAAVAPGGTILVVGHDLLNLTEGYGGPSNAEVLFTPDDVAGELDGLQVDRTERVRRAVEDEHGEHQAIDALVVARRPHA
jgi:SAM-dependent methyltransferase